MLPELGIERVFRRELDSLPVPEVELWVPDRRRASSAMLAAFVAVAALVLVLAAIGLVRDESSAATHPRGAVSPVPSLPSRPTCAPPAYGADGHCSTRVPNLFRSVPFGYSFTIPGDWREELPAGSEPFVRDRTTGQPSLTAPFLLDRHVFTARAPDQLPVIPAEVGVPTWDLDVQVWDRQGRSATDWSHTFGSCDPGVVSFGSGCTATMESLHGTLAVVTSFGVAPGFARTTSYYIEHGDQIVILRYRVDSRVAPPPGVTEATLQGIVRSLGLV
jgi:hypothetical protein